VTRGRSIIVETWVHRTRAVFEALAAVPGVPSAPPRVIAPPPPEYDVVWNGANDGKDGDLLNASLRQPEKAAGGAPTRVYGTLHRVLDLFLAHPDRKFTFGEVHTITGVGKQQVNSALYHLRQHGRLASELINPSDPRDRAPQRYWLKAEAAKGES
jgi:hypothetical protein